MFIHYVSHLSKVFYLSLSWISANYHLSIEVPLIFLVFILYQRQKIDVDANVIKVKGLGGISINDD